MKQFLSPLAEPLGAVWLLIVLGVLWLLLRRQWRSAIWLAVPTVLLFLVGSTPIADDLVAIEEMRWDGNKSSEAGVAGSPTAPADAVVALGGGHRTSKHDPLGFAVCDGASRLLTAVELMRSGHAKTLVLGGSVPLAGTPATPSMALVQDWIVRWGPGERCHNQPRHMPDYSRRGGYVQETHGQPGLAKSHSRHFRTPYAPL